MNSSELTEWKRSTAIRKFKEARDGVSKAGVGMSDERLAKAIAGYVDVTPEQVLAWVRGQ